MSRGSKSRILKIKTIRMTILMTTQTLNLRHFLLYLVYKK